MSFARRRSPANKSANASMPNPAPAFFKKSRRLPTASNRPQCWLNVFMAASINVNEFVHREKGLAKVGQRLLARISLRCIAGRAPADLALDELSCCPDLARRCLPAKGQSPSHSNRRFGSWFFADPPGKIDGARSNKSVVQQRQRLRSDSRTFAPSATGCCIGSVERLHERILHDAFVKHVNRAAMRRRRI